MRIAIAAMAIAVWVAALPAAATAAPLRWSFDGASLLNGAPVTGSFIFDASAGAVSDIDVRVDGILYGFLAPAATPYDFAFATFDTGGVLLGAQILGIVLANPPLGSVPDAVEAISPGVSGLVDCGSVNCTVASAFISNFAPASADLTSSAVPLPASAVLLLSGLAVISAAGRRARRSGARPSSAQRHAAPGFIQARPSSPERLRPNAR